MRLIVIAPLSLTFGASISRKLDEAREAVRQVLLTKRLEPRLDIQFCDQLAGLIRDRLLST
jgi:hypothetical protein